MTTTLEAFRNARRGNYCTLPTVDVEILTDEALCESCDTPVVYDRKGGSWASGAWVHAADVDTSQPCRRCDGVGHTVSAMGREYGCSYCKGTGTAHAEHFVSARTRCSYCGTQDPALVKYVQASYSDEVRCTRCGGTNGFGIGD